MIDTSVERYEDFSYGHICEIAIHDIMHGGGGGGQERDSLYLSYAIS